MTEAIINLQALLVKSYLLNARKASPIGYHGAQVLRPASRMRARNTSSNHRADTLTIARINETSCTARDHTLGQSRCLCRAAAGSNQAQ
jgi:hypothetical protein